MTELQIYKLLETDYSKSLNTYQLIYFTQWLKDNHVICMT